MVTKKVKESTGLALNPTTITKDDVPMLLAKVEEKIASLKGIKDNTPMIDAELAEHGKITNIKTREGLDTAMSTVLGKSQFGNAAQEAFELANPGIKRTPFKICGYTTDQWKAALTYQEKVVSFGDELARLEKMKELLKKNLSEEDKFKSDIADVFSLISL